MVAKKGNGSETAKTANAIAAKEGKKNPRTSSAAQAELGRKGGTTNAAKGGTASSKQQGKSGEAS